MAKPILSDRAVFDRPAADPKEFQDRCASAVNLLRALAISVVPEMHCHDFRLNEWDIHHSCMGVAELLEALQVDLCNYFGERADKKRKSAKPVVVVDNTREPEATRADVSAAN